MHLGKLWIDGVPQPLPTTLILRMSILLHPVELEVILAKQRKSIPNIPRHVYAARVVVAQMNDVNGASGAELR